MAKRTAQKRKAVGFTAANERTPKAFEVSRVTTFERPDLLILLGLAIVTFWIYAQVIGHRFITFDDPSYIEENPMVNRGVTLAGLAWAFTTVHSGNWHPLTWIAHMIDSQLFGMIAGGHLLVSALIHAANTLLLFWFLLRTTHARWSSALVAALFALHPLHVESVAWAAERKDTLSTFFGLLSLTAYTRYAEAPSARRYAWTSITLVLGLMAKPMLVTWPFVMLLLDYWPNDLAVYYPFPEAGTPAWQIIGAAFLLIGITALCLSQRKIRPYLIVGWLWFLGTLVPVIGLVQVGGQTMADRYFYIPSIGLFVAIVFGLADIAERRRVTPWLSAAIANVVLLVLATLTNAQIHRWSDSFTLFNHALMVAPPSVAAENSLGYAKQRNGRLDEAAAHYEKALQIRPVDDMSLLYIGVVRFYQGRVP